jgi:hypothetical protein
VELRGKRVLYDSDSLKAFLGKWIGYKAGYCSVSDENVLGCGSLKPRFCLPCVIGEKAVNLVK